jgi:glycosyltransferase involved in cell wall biosynthesis
MAAKMREAWEFEYFEMQVKPHLGDDIAYLGEVPHEHKLELLAGAMALLNPIRWNEPFGLVMLEALACGTPVLAFPEGAAPEVVEDGVSGFLVADEDEMAARVPDAGRLEPLRVRRSAERFAPDRIAAGYERAYRAAALRRAHA